MSLHVDPLLPPGLLASALVVYCLLAAVFYQQHRHYISWRYWSILAAAKAVSIVAVAILLLNPYFVAQIPDSSKFSIAVLVDATGSMQTGDCSEGKGRLATVHERLLGPEAPLLKEVLASYDNVRYYAFAGDELRRFEPGTPFDTLPGDTDIDGILGRLLANNAENNTLGAVVLISDGLDNRGVSLMEGAKGYKRRSIPIHCVGVGDHRQKRDLGVHWLSVPAKAGKGKPFTLSAGLERNFTGAFETKVTVFDGIRPITEKIVSFPAGVEQVQVDFEHSAFVAGFTTYKVRVEQLPSEENTLNNVDFAGLQVTEPDVYEIFYFTASLDWDFKFLKTLMDEEERLRLGAVIRVGEKTFYVRGGEAPAAAGDDAQGVPEPAVAGKGLEALLQGFPDSSLINQYDAVILDLSSVYLLSEADVATVVKFVENRGGGLVLTGLAAEVPDAIAQLLPVKALPSEILKVDKAALSFRPSSVLAPRKLDRLQELANRLAMPPNSFFYKIGPDQLKPAALTVATVKGTDWVTLAAHNYGSGKVALLNLNDTWKWVMTEDGGDRDFGVFWGQLLSWIASSSRQRMTVKPAASKLDLARERIFTVDLLDDGFVPDNNAQVSATVLLPSGDEEQMTFFSSPRLDGRYLGKFVPREPGEYRVRIKARLHGEETLESVADYVVVDQSPESEPHPMAETRLQSLARLTGGQYWNYRDAAGIDEIPITQQVSYVTERRGWLGYWHFLAAMILAILPDWALRRRIGLR